MSDILWLAAALSLPTAVIIVCCNYYRTKKTLDTLEKMLDSVMDGSFSEEIFDERRLSRLETRFAHYLSASAVSARKTAAEKDKIKTLIADISHQTKTPIANLLLYSELLREEEMPDNARSNVDALYNQTEKLRFLIDSLVKLSRLENGIISLSPSKEAIQPILLTIYNQYLPKAEAKGLTLHMSDTDAYAVLDTKWTAEAIGNIVDNAVKYTEQGGLTISVTEYEIFTRIDIADTGIGISEEELPKIFTRFFRSENVKNFDGVGIGLYLARKIISEQNGYIKVTSHPGEGSCFSVFLPR
ncbi:MAG: HAMP domain-containing histidine kinase [Lachnospiraceae bacterium]|nr:HAMP domain-containing histidine kinase [Lachnospiraceae bacterium]